MKEFIKQTLRLGIVAVLFAASFSFITQLFIIDTTIAMIGVGTYIAIRIIEAVVCDYIDKSDIKK